MENEKDLIFRTGLTILDERGSYEPRDGVRVAHIYEDDKIYLEALMSLQGGGQIESFLISVKMFPLDEMPVRTVRYSQNPAGKTNSGVCVAWDSALLPHRTMGRVSADVD